jgi:predicted phosphoribosyltransferase
LVIVRKLGVPSQPELAMGAIVDGSPPLVVRNESVIAMAGVDSRQFAVACGHQLDEARHRRQMYLRGRTRVAVKGKTVIIVDDGIATGASMRAALRSVRKEHPKLLVVAVPVAASGALKSLEDEADDIVCLEAHTDLRGVGAHYDDFRQVDDEEVIAALANQAVNTAPAVHRR